jgi:predicted transposase YdaD
LGGCPYCNDSDSTGRDWTSRQLDASGSALQMGLTLEQIAQGLNLPIEEVKQAAQSE